MLSGDIFLEIKRLPRARLGQGVAEPNQPDAVDSRPKEPSESFGRHLGGAQAHLEGSEHP